MINDQGTQGIKDTKEDHHFIAFLRKQESRKNNWIPVFTGMQKKEELGVLVSWWLINN